MTPRTNYPGLPLKNPIVVSSCPLSHNIDSLRRLEDAGASAVVMYSLFEEQITFDSFDVDYYLQNGTNSHADRTISPIAPGRLRNQDLEPTSDLLVMRFTTNW
jgi:hypothetical protein